MQGRVSLQNQALSTTKRDKRLYLTINNVNSDSLTGAKTTATFFERLSKTLCHSKLTESDFTKVILRAH